MGSLAPELDAVVAYRAEIYQASGMVAVQLQIPPAEALLRIRAHAFAHDTPVSAVANEIVARRLRLGCSASSATATPPARCSVGTGASPKWPKRPQQAHCRSMRSRFRLRPQAAPADRLGQSLQLHLASHGRCLRSIGSTRRQTVDPSPNIGRRVIPSRANVWR